jgi:hypothetical protein
MLVTPTVAAIALTSTVVVLHETLHILGYQLYKIKCKVKMIWWHRIPIAFAVESDYFAGTYSSLPADKRVKYAVIAGLPYTVIIPLCVYWMFIAHPIIGASIGIAHLINWPLEYGV